MAPTFTFADLLRRYRRAAGLTQEELAERSGLSARVISDLERGIHQRPRRDTLALLAEALDLAPEERAALVAAGRERQLAGAALVSPHWQHGAGTALPPLAGRTAELDVMERHLLGGGERVGAGIRPGEPAPLLLLAGEPGIGKSRLLREAAERVHSLGISVVAGGCHRRSGQEPYAPFPGALAQAIASLSREAQREALNGCAWLARLLPELVETGAMASPSWTLPPDQERRLMFEAVGRFLSNAAGPSGTLLILDDLQWAGTDALDLLAAIVRGPSSVPLRVLGAYRDTEVRPGDALDVLLADLAREELAARREIGPLPPQDSAALLAGLLPDNAEAGARLRARLLERAGGVPFFLISCAQEMRTGEAQSADTERDELPWSVTASIRQRVLALPTTARELLGTAAVVGRIASRSVLLSVSEQAGNHERETVDGLEAAVAARLLLEAGSGGYQFTHDLIREVVAADLSAARRAQLHLRVAEALEQASDHLGEQRAAELAWHFLLGDDRRRALTYTLAAGDQAETRYAHDEAERHFLTAAELASALGEVVRSGESEEKLGAVLEHRSRFTDATGAYERAADAYRLANDLESLQRVTAELARSWQSRGSAWQGEAILRPQLAAAIGGDPSAGVARMYLALGTLSSDPRERLAACERAGELARALGDVRMQAEAEFMRGSRLVTLGRIEAAGEALEAAIPLLEATGDLFHLCAVLSLLADVCLRQGRLNAARAYINRGLEIAERVGVPEQLTWVCCNDGELAFYAGDWAQAQAAFARAEVVRRAEGSEVFADLVRLSQGRLALAQGRADDATRLLDEAIAESDTLGDDAVEALQVAHTTLAERDLVHEDFAAARARLEPLLARFEDSQGLVTRLLPSLAWAHLGLGDAERAEALARDAVARAAAEPQRPVQAEALRVLGMALASSGRHDEAQRTYEKSLVLCREMPHPYAEAKTLYASGLLLRELGDEPRARERLGAALAICARLGERLYGEQIECALEAPVLVGGARPARRSHAARRPGEGEAPADHGGVGGAGTSTT